MDCGFVCWHNFMKKNGKTKKNVALKKLILFEISLMPAKLNFAPVYSEILSKDFYLQYSKNMCWSSLTGWIHRCFLVYFEDCRKLGVIRLGSNSELEPSLFNCSYCIKMSFLLCLNEPTSSRYKYTPLAKLLASQSNRCMPADRCSATSVATSSPNRL